MKPTPPDWPRMASSVFYRDAAAAIDRLCRAFGFEVRLRIEGAGGRIEHSELVYGDGLVMVGEEGLATDAKPWRRSMRSPHSLGGATTQSILFFVDDADADADAHCAHARACGTQIVDEPTTHDYGADHWCDCSYAELDPEGHLWWITQRLHTAPGE